MSAMQQFFTNQALHLHAGRFDLLAQSYAQPLVLMFPGRGHPVYVLPHRKAVKRFFEAKFEGLQAAGIDYLRAMVTEMPVAGSHRQTAKVVWHYRDSDARHRGKTTARYFLSRSGGGLKVEMIEFYELAFPAVIDWATEAGKAATWERDRIM